MMYILPSEEVEEVDVLLEGDAAGAEEELDAGDGLLLLLPLLDEGLGELPELDDPEEDESDEDVLLLLPCACQQ